MEASDQSARLDHLVSTIQQLGDSMTLTREKAKTNFKATMEITTDQTDVIVSIALIRQMFSSRRWEDRHGAI
jgi:hypothetical protein